MRLYHFSENPNIEVFEPRPVRRPVKRPSGQEWLNGPLVWAIDDRNSFLYLFPRECPRILVWPTPYTTSHDGDRWLGATDAAVVAFIEAAWFAHLCQAVIYRYEMPPGSFENVGEIGMWVSKSHVRPAGVHRLSNLHECLEEGRIDLRVMETLTPLRDIWNSTLHVSGIRLRNALGWGKPGWPHSKPRLIKS